MDNGEISECSEFLNLRGGIPLIDVRAPLEFAQGHIVGAVNVPLFDDQQRADVGTTYKQKGRRHAIRLGLDLIGPRMRRLVDQVENLCGIPDRDCGPTPVLVYCARGGMRSDSVCWLLRQTDFQPLRLAGGYKFYRQHCHEFLEQHWDLVALTGMTGAGKTRLLKELEASGEQIVDLEGLAHHRGSAFGGIGQPDQPTTEQFENLLFEKLLACDRNRRIWVEDESRSVGKCVVPSGFFDQLHAAPAVRLDVDVRERNEFLVSEYGQLPPADLIAAIQRIGKRLGGQHVNAAIAALEKGDLELCTKILLVYYDKTYETCRIKNPRDKVFPVDLTGCSAASRVSRVLEVADQLVPAV